MHSLNLALATVVSAAHLLKAAQPAELAKQLREVHPAIKRLPGHNEENYMRVLTMLESADEFVRSVDKTVSDGLKVLQAKGLFPDGKG